MSNAGSREGMSSDSMSGFLHRLMVGFERLSGADSQGPHQVPSRLPGILADEVEIYPLPRHDLPPYSREIVERWSNQVEELRGITPWQHQTEFSSKLADELPILFAAGVDRPYVDRGISVYLERRTAALERWTSEATQGAVDVTDVNERGVTFKGGRYVIKPKHPFPAVDDIRAAAGRMTSTRLPHHQAVAIWDHASAETMKRLREGIKAMFGHRAHDIELSYEQRQTIIDVIIGKITQQHDQNLQAKFADISASIEIGDFEKVYQQWSSLYGSYVNFAQNAWRDSEKGLAQEAAYAVSDRFKPPTNNQYALGIYGLMDLCLGYMNELLYEHLAAFAATSSREAQQLFGGDVVRKVLADAMQAQKEGMKGEEVLVHLQRTYPSIVDPNVRNKCLTYLGQLNSRRFFATNGTDTT